MSTKALYKFHFKAGRKGTLHGVFVAADEEILSALGKHLSFGEVLGKHSDVHGQLENEDLTRVTDDEVFVAKFEEYGCRSGYNPLEYLPESEDGTTEEEES